MNISNRVKGMSEPALLKYYPMVEKEREKGKYFYELNIGQPDIKTPPAFMSAVTDMKKKVLPYVSTEGIKPLREAIAAYYRKNGYPYDVEDILVTSGGSEALLFAFLTICNPGDSIITPEPMYSIYKELASVSNVNLIPIETKTEEGFALPPKEVINALMMPQVKGILITNPGNPTGKVFTEEEIQVLGELAEEYDAWLLTDEVYREFVYDRPHCPSPGKVKELEDRVIMIDSASKRYSACGARIGLVASKNKEVMKEILKLCQMRLSVSYIDQLGAVNLFQLDEKFFQATLEEYRQRRNVVYEGLHKIEGVVCAKPGGAFYVVAKLPVDDSSDFIEWMITDFELENETVLLSPMHDFYYTKNKGEDEVRIAYVLNAEDLKRALEILEAGLKEYNNRKR
jgi:aspartate aminotransferase